MVDIVSGPALLDKPAAAPGASPFRLASGRALRLAAIGSGAGGLAFASPGGRWRLALEGGGILRVVGLAGDFEEEAAGDGGSGFAPFAAAEGQGESPLGPGDADVAEASFLVDVGPVGLDRERGRTSRAKGGNGENGADGSVRRRSADDCGGRGARHAGGNDV